MCLEVYRTHSFERDLRLPLVLTVTRDDNDSKGGLYGDNLFVAVRMSTLFAALGHVCHSQLDHTKAHSESLVSVVQNLHSLSHARYLKGHDCASKRFRYLEKASLTHTSVVSSLQNVEPS